MNRPSHVCTQVIGWDFIRILHFVIIFSSQPGMENFKNNIDTCLYTIVTQSTSSHPTPLERRYEGY
jgi:hypothetical protein